MGLSRVGNKGLTCREKDEAAAIDILSLMLHICIYHYEPGGRPLDDAGKKERIEAYQRLCREKGLRSTIQKRAILEAVLDLDNHPTADQVHEAVTRESPDISRTTVYRALETFARLGLITKACHPGSATRYDRKTDIHHHLICLHCDAVIDISDTGLDRLSIPDTSGFDFEVQDFRVQLRGRCRRCREKKLKEE